MDAGTYVALAIAMPFILFPLAFVWYINGGGIYKALKRAGVKGKQALGKLECAMDADCPQGFVCVDGQCVKA